MNYVISLNSNLRKRKEGITISQYDWIVTMQLAARSLDQWETAIETQAN